MKPQWKTLKYLLFHQDNRTGLKKIPASLSVSYFITCHPFGDGDQEIEHFIKQEK